MKQKLKYVQLSKEVFKRENKRYISCNFLQKLEKYQLVSGSRENILRISKTYKVTDLFEVIFIF